MSEDVFTLVDFDNVDAPTTEERKYPTLRPNSWYGGRVVEEQAGKTDKTGAPYIRTVLAPIDGEGKASRPTCRHDLWLPRKKTDQDGNPVPWKGISFLMQYARAFEGVEEYPYSIRKRKGQFTNEEGEVISEADAKAFNNEVKDKTLTFVKERLGSLGSFVGREVYFKTGPAEVVNGRTYINVDRLAHDLPEDAELMTDPSEWSVS